MAISELPAQPSQPSFGVEPFPAESPASRSFWRQRALWIWLLTFVVVAAALGLADLVVNSASASPGGGCGGG